jgi:hypothetical protein
MVFFSRTSLERALTHYVAHYREERNHQGLQNHLLKRSDRPTIIGKRPDDGIFRHYAIIEVDVYPPATTPRRSEPGLLPPGNALVTLEVDDFEALTLSFIRPPMRREGALYGGRRTGTIRGTAGELIELLEIGALSWFRTRLMRTVMHS